MARLESIRFTGQRCAVIDGHVQWTATGTEPVEGLPQICWESGEPWREANLWLFDRTVDKDVKLKTVVSNATSLHAYAEWLESSSTNWWDFPQRQRDRCLVRYRGALKKARDEGDIAPSTASARMRVAVAFYRWLWTEGLISPTWPMWQERLVGIRLVDPVGFERTIVVNSTSLALPNRKRPGQRLENGVVPVSPSERDAIMELAREHASPELRLILALGFFTGMRLGTICDLKVQTLFNAAVDPELPGLYRVALGPGATPPVATKFDVTGQVGVLAALMDCLREYVDSVRRLKREALASPEKRDLVFLTRFGNAYAQRGADRSASLNVEMHRLKKLGVANGISMRHFRFHQTRATFGTALAKYVSRVAGEVGAVAIVRDQLLQKDEATALKYIRFSEKTPAKAEAANAFTRDFLGVIAQKAEPEAD
jgi:integrase